MITNKTSSSEIPNNSADSDELRKAITIRIDGALSKRCKHIGDNYWELTGTPSNTVNELVDALADIIDQVCEQRVIDTLQHFIIDSVVSHNGKTARSVSVKKVECYIDQLNQKGESDGT